LRKSLDSNPTIEETIIQKNKITNHSLEDSDLDNDFDFSCDEYSTIKKKQNKLTLDRNTKYTQNSNQTSPRKMCHESMKTVIKSNFSQRKQQDKSKEFQSFTKSKKYVNDNKESENIINNKQHLPEKQNFYVPSVFSQFLQKCGIILSIDGIHILSKSSIFLKKKENL